MLLNGTAPPTAGDGADGDFWIDTTAWAIYGPKAAGAWPSGVSLIGKSGSDPTVVAGLPTAVDLSDDDLLTILDDPAGSPVAKKIAAAAVRRYTRSLQPKRIAAPNYVLQSVDMGRSLIFTASTPISLLVPAGLPAGFGCTVTQWGTGAISVLCPDVILHAPSGYLATNA